MRSSWIVAAALLTSPLFGEEKLKSGNQPGEALVPFDVIDVTGEFKTAEKVCYV
jgi:hypothetical protein